MEEQGARYLKRKYNNLKVVLPERFYQDDDHVSLAPGVELNYEKDAAQPAANATQSQERSAMNPALREFVANAAICMYDNAIFFTPSDTWNLRGLNTDISTKNKVHPMAKMQTTTTSHTSAFRPHFSHEPWAAPRT